MFDSVLNASYCVFCNVSSLCSPFSFLIYVMVLFMLPFLSWVLLVYASFFQIFLLPRHFFLEFLYFCFVIFTVVVTSLIFINSCKNSYNVYLLHCYIFLVSILWQLAQYVAHFYYFSYSISNSVLCQLPFNSL